MKKPLIFILFLFVFSLITPGIFAQSPPMGKKSKMKLNYRGYSLKNIRWEAGFSLGMANSMTDVAPSEANTQAGMTDFYSRGLSPALSLYGRYRSHNIFALKGNISALMLRGNDRWSPDIEVVNRGRSFTNTIFEGALVGEFYLPKKQKRIKSDFSLNTMDLYLFTGLAGFYHSPQVKGAIIDDYDFNILNADNIYSNWQVAVPIGAGLQWTLGYRWILGMDVNFRYTFFDYLDGFRRPYSSRNDFFFSSNINLGFIIDSEAYQTRNSTPIHVFKKFD